MSLKLLIRSATVEDAPAISALVTASVREHIAPSLSDDGLSHLLSEMTTENQSKRIRSGYQFFVALESDTLIGTAAIRPPSHLYYLFVDTQHQRRGIGRQLWNHARDWITCSDDHGPITVNSSLNAIAVYESFGFAILGPPEENHGVRYQPMLWANAT
jgi:GNAT superfamily N-acetyltransferase